MWLKTASLVITGFLAAWIITRKRPQDAFLPLVLAGLNGIPLLILGNSANGSVFSVDIALAACVLRFGPGHARGMFDLAAKRGVLDFFVMLVVWISFTSAIAALQEPKVAKFTAYGAARWWMFLTLVVLFFGQRLTPDDLTRRYRGLALALGVYGCICLMHQHGVFDLAGSETLGERAAESIQAQLSSEESDLAVGHRRFLGMTSANIGSVCALGAWVPLAAWARTRRSGVLWVAIAIVLSWALVGTWSRSNVVGLLAALALGVGCYIRYLAGPGRLVLTAGVLSVAAAGLAFSMFAGRSMDAPTFDRYRDTLSEYTPQGEGTGGHRFREHGKIFIYLLDHPHVAISGLGANGYRRLMWCGAATMMFGHNIYLHTIYELGLPGFVLLAFWLFRVSRLGLCVGSADRQACTMALLVTALIVQRAIAGWGADTFFATEGMLQSNVLFLALVGMAWSAHGATVPVKTVSFASAPAAAATA